MRLETRTAKDVAALTMSTLGLDPQRLVLTSPEVVSASLRRAASFLCPTTQGVLVDTTLELLNPLLSEPLRRDEVAGLLDQLISTGDLLELAAATPERTARLLYLGPPSYVEKVPGKYLLIGIRPSGAPLVPEQITVEHNLHIRTAVLDGAEPEIRLKEAGLHRISTGQWIGQPAALPAHEYVDEYRQRLGVARSAGSIDGLTIIDPSAKPTYYRGRWRPPASADTGDFVGRRPQAYGADIWCVVRLVNGNPDRLIDLPVRRSVSPARDDAWRLQAAFDAERGTPQVARTHAILDATSTTECVVDLFSPLPSWAERYLELVGRAVDKSPGALFSYCIPLGALEELRSVLTGTLWMSITDGESK
jgi:hypothetical protein